MRALRTSRQHGSLRGIQCRLLFAERTRHHSPDTSLRGVNKHILRSRSLSAVPLHTGTRRWPPGSHVILQHLPHSSIHHHATSSARRCVGSRSKQNGEDLRRIHPRRRNSKNHSVPPISLYARNSQANAPGCCKQTEVKGMKKC
jgi:hypothetical protein